MELAGVGDGRGPLGVAVGNAMPQPPFGASMDTLASLRASGLDASALGAVDAPSLASGLAVPSERIVLPQGAGVHLSLIPRGRKRDLFLGFVDRSMYPLRPVDEWQLRMHEWDDALADFLASIATSERKVLKGVAAAVYSVSPGYFMGKPYPRRRLEFLLPPGVVDPSDPPPGVVFDVFPLVGGE